MILCIFMTILGATNSAIAEKQDSVLFKIKESTKNHLKNEYLKNFLSTAEINNLPENWAISYDLQNSSILLGYLWGFFTPLVVSIVFLNWDLVGVLDGQKIMHRYYYVTLIQ